MSVWKKASKANQKTHRERHQPDARSHLGLLEKKKDYVKRAQDYNDKQQTLKLLRKRALNKNPDEFYHHMINSKVTKDGVHHEKDTSDEHSQEQLKLMDTQDIRYVNMKRTQEMKKIKRLQSHLHFIDVDNKPKNTHKLFFDSKDECQKFQEEKQKEKKEIVNYSQEKLSEKTLDDFDPEFLASLTRKRKASYEELASRIKREAELNVVQQKIEVKRYLRPKKKQMNPTKVQAATKDAPPIYKWKFQRLK